MLQKVTFTYGSCRARETVNWHDFCEFLSNPSRSFSFFLFSLVKQTHTRESEYFTSLRKTNKHHKLLLEEGPCKTGSRNLEIVDSTTKGDVDGSKSPKKRSKLVVCFRFGLCATEISFDWCFLSESPGVYHLVYTLVYPVGNRSRHLYNVVDPYFYFVSWWLTILDIYQFD